jgi:hypothetical protein
VVAIRISLALKLFDYSKRHSCAANHIFGHGNPPTGLDALARRKVAGFPDL